MRLTKRARWIIAVAIALVYLSVFFVSWICGEIDYRRVKTGDAPLFARYHATYLDGGSTEYHGPFYVLMKHKELTSQVMPDGRIRLEIGPAIEYTHDNAWPLFGALRRDRRETHLEP